MDFVRHDRRGLAGQGWGAAARRIDALLLLPAVAEPDTDHLLLHVELLRHQQDLLRRRLLVLEQQRRGKRNKSLENLDFFFQSTSVDHINKIK